MAPPSRQKVNPASSPKESKENASNGAARQDATLVYVLAFGPKTVDGTAPLVATTSHIVDALAVWSVSDVETSTTIYEPSLRLVCFNRTTLYGVKFSQPHCFNASGHLNAGLATTPEIYTRLTPISETVII
eukprot:gnl/MRDRNA2_/MRDRNA2_229061_c0_seq1.p1 gnl/MRDRNA2_/MRDRNA2_229061_c0~~gnl/MRDRNA2_/MRDRNA2_229061_c0_seq1.p1  ORF type:complete len:144 (-),score=9.69 gnl/MRDRNA2_/MRDRNA2_229061_c0_seq1:81-473(-)